MIDSDKQKIIVGEDYYLQHYGKQGMKWGQRNPTRKEGRRELKEVRKSARRLIKSHKKAESSSERKAIAKQYESKVLNRIKSKDFKKAYQVANTTGKGEMAAIAVLTGGVGAISIANIRAQNRRFGQGVEESVARNILKEMRR